MRGDGNGECPSFEGGKEKVGWLVLDFVLSLGGFEFESGMGVVGNCSHFEKKIGDFRKFY